MITYQVDIRQVGQMVLVDFKAPPGNATEDEIKVAKRFSDMMREFAASLNAITIKECTPAKVKRN